MFFVWPAGFEKALQPDHWGDVPLHVAPSENQQQDILHRRAGNENSISLTPYHKQELSSLLQNIKVLLVSHQLYQR